MSRLSRSLLILPAVIALNAVGGCGSADSDREAREKLDKAYAHRAAGDTGNTHGTLADEVAKGQSGDVTMAMAHELVGDISVDQAAAVVAGQGREPEPGLGALQTSTIILAEHANRLATALAMSRTYIETEQKRDPTTALEAIEQQLSVVQAGEGWNPGPEVEGQLPALETTQQRIDSLNSRLTELNGQITELTQQRDDLLAQASDLDQQSDQQQGQASVDTYRKVADLRTQAAEVAAGTERLRAEVRKTTAQLEEAQALRAALEQTVATLQQQRDSLAQKWTQVQEQINQINESAQATFTSQEMDEARGNPRSSLELMSRELGPALASMAEQRAAAVALLTKAADSYQSADSRASAANSQRNELFRAAYATAFSGSRISLSRANALRQLGSLHAASAGAYAAVFQLQQTLEEAGRALPDTVLQAMAEPPRESFIQAVDAAAKALVEANDLLGNLGSGGGEAISDTAITQRAAVVAGLWSLHSLIETTGVPITVQMPSVNDLRDEARQLTELAKTADTPIPAAAPFVGATTQPTTGPATEAATQEAEGEATTQPAEEGAAEQGEAGGDAAGDAGGGTGGQP